MTIGGQHDTKQIPTMFSSGIVHDFAGHLAGKDWSRTRSVGSVAADRAREVAKFSLNFRFLKCTRSETLERSSRSLPTQRANTQPKTTKENVCKKN
jgi:hypothetical protein